MAVLTQSVFLPRLSLGLLLSTSIFFPSFFQGPIDHIYAYLLSTSIYRASTFETFWTVFIYGVIEPLYTYKFGHNPHLRLAVQKNGDSQKPLPKLRRPSKRLNEGLIYILPLLTMDLTMIKKFSGVPVRDMAMSGNYDPETVALRGSFLAPTLHRFTVESPLQTRRALPLEAPSSRQLVLQLAASIVLYDAVFFLFHLALHKLPFLSRIHRIHHGHSEINPQITNQLDIIDRLGLVLLANFSLNIIGSHVLTRTLFVPMFVWLLVDIHSGMDLPWSYDKLLPKGWAAGSKRHGDHHQDGTRYYEPFFNWCDDAYEWLSQRSLRSSELKS